MTQTNKVVKGWLDALGHPRHALTKWEADFVESVAEQLEARGAISDRQEEILEKLYAEKT